MGEKMKRLRPRGVVSVVGVLAATALLIAAPAAFAQQIGPTDDQYDSALEVIGQGEQGAPPSGDGPGEAPSAEPTAAVEDQGGALPFTGLEIGGMIAAALILGGSGLALRYAARTRAANRAGV
jgi:hypothetical protein